MESGLAHDVMREKLIEVARRGGKVNYKEAGAWVGIEVRGRVGIPEVTGVLCAVTDTEHGERRPMLTVLVCLARKAVPGVGFFEKARSLEYPARDEKGFARSERQKVYSYWQSHDHS